jgi:(p)ppGpp synthase/HD superfamily hydrolase
MPTHALLRRDQTTHQHFSKEGAFMKEWVTVLRAADAAARWHVHQRRKGAAEEPYINHLLEVAMLVAEATNGKDPELVIAALLHDSIEDQEVSRTVLVEKFGENVAALVEEVTDDKNLEKQERKRRQEEHAHRKSTRAKILKLADKTSNLKAIAASPPPTWSVKRRLEYIDWARKVAKGLVGTSEWLEKEFNQAAKEAERSVVQ